MATLADVTTTTFRGFPADTLLEAGNLPVEELARIALREGQATSPLHRVHRWFARRLSSQFRGMLTALSLCPEEAEVFWDRYFGEIPLEHAVVVDPFAGGGTAVVEASRCGARVAAFDLDPVATSITQFELGAAALHGLSDDARAACVEASQQIAPFHKTSLCQEEADVLHHFWVQVDDCRACGAEFEVHPHYRLAYDKNNKRQWVFCRQCHEVQELPLFRKRLSCRCGTYTAIDRGTLIQQRLRCPHCGSRAELSSRGKETQTPPRWRLFALEYLEPDSDNTARAYKAATEADRELYREAAARLRNVEAYAQRFLPTRSIPTEGRYDRRPLIHGFTQYRELFNERQLLHLAILGQTIARLENRSDKQLLGLAFSEHLTTNCMYTGYAFGYRRLSPLFSVHAYRHIVRPVEINPWLTARGTFPNALEKIRRGVAFAKAPADLHPDGGRGRAGRPVGPRDGKVGRAAHEVFKGTAQAAVSTQDSTNLPDVPENSVDLILTDPPYFDNICYSELSDFYLVWHQALGIADPPYDDRELAAPMMQSLAPVNRASESVRRYAEGLRKVFGECHRVLKAQGVCVFTFHHASPLAWMSLGEALARSGLRCTGVLPMRGEGKGGLHSYAGTIKWDAVLVCRKGQEPTTSDGYVAMVPTPAVPWATEIVRKWAEHLSHAEGVEFHAPDELNLYRGLLISRAQFVEPSEGWVTLDRALKKTLQNQEEVSRG